MGHDERREILERLEALERLVRSRSGEDGGRDEHRRGGSDRRDRDRDDRDDYDRRDHDRGRHERSSHGRHGHDRDHHGRDRGHRDHDRHDRDRRDDDRYRGGGDGEFQEKRIIDTVVKLVGERVERFIQDQQAKTQRHDDGDRERRVIDHVVRLVGEHVREIVQRVVANELDRRVGPPRDERLADASPREPKPEER